MPRQLSFLPRLRLDHGGSVRFGKRKIARPYDPKRPLHLVLKSSRAKGKWSMLMPRNKVQLHLLLERLSRKYSVRVLDSANVGNHLHLLVQAKEKRQFQSFLREFAGTLASLITGGIKGQAQGRFWDGLIYSRVVNWGRDLARVQVYLIKNLLEGIGWDSRKQIDRAFQFATLARSAQAPPGE